MCPAGIFWHFALDRKVRSRWSAREPVATDRLYRVRAGRGVRQMGPRIPAGYAYRLELRGREQDREVGSRPVAATPDMLRVRSESLRRPV